ncbi:hypothetical protein GOP47_0006585 [Adiantum capillus-veneris]|uniref:Uncharacterized protein n=1 Tax=Adiantum capillus-veneris TaxID=13818 RepID=A0A9D4V354_ADICA|nr:hypothetical protein GOP47_0006585 [Adiantum capillus-veneris]
MFANLLLVAIKVDFFIAGDAVACKGLELSETTRDAIASKPRKGVAQQHQTCWAAHALRPAGAKAAVLCFSTTDRSSFESIESWKKKVEEQCGRIPMVLVQTKVDLLDEAAVERHESEALAEILGVRFYRICAKQNLYIAEVFEYLAELYLRWDVQCMQTPRIVIGRSKQFVTLEEERNSSSFREENPLFNKSNNQNPSIDANEEFVVESRLQVALGPHDDRPLPDVKPDLQ